MKTHFSAVKLQPWRLCVLSGLLLAAAFPRLDWGFLALVALIPLLSTFPHNSHRQALLSGFLCGFAFFGVLLYWIAVFTYHVIGALGILAWFLSASIQASYIALFAVSANAAWNRAGAWGRVPIIPSLWILCEWLRQLGTFGMGWGDLAYTQWKSPLMLAVAPLTGIWGISWLLVAASVTVLQWPRRAVLPVVLVALAGLYCPDVSIIRHGEAVVAPIQANINEDVPWLWRRPVDAKYFADTLATFGGMIHQSASHDASLCVLAETALPGYPDNDSELRTAVTSWATTNHVTILAGAHHSDVRSGKDQNVVYEISPTGQWSRPYAKTKLVPFGEYVPYRRFFPFLEAMHVAVFDMKAGDESQAPLTAAGSDWRIGPMICYESTYARYARQQVLAGATTLAVVTDDTWFGRTAAAKQHEAMSALRAAETHRPLVRCGATGISAIFNENGVLITELGLFKRGVISAAISPQTVVTPYVRFGDWFVVVCTAIVGIGFGLMWRMKRVPSEPSSTRY